MGQSIVIASGKGGVGKTSVTAGVGSCLAALGKHVVCVDADIGLRNLDLALGLYDKALFDFHDVLEGRAQLKDALVKHPEIPNLMLLTAPSSIQPEEISKDRFNSLIRALADGADFVLVDSAAGIGQSFSLAAQACTGAIIVTTPEQLAIHDSAKCAELLTSHNPARLVVNRVRPKLIKRRHAQNVDEAIDATGLQLLGIIPEDEMVIAAQNHNMPVILLESDGAAVAYLNIAERLCGIDRPLQKRLKVWRVDR